VFFEFGGTAIYKFGASDVLFQELRPSNLMIWEAIRTLAERGCALLHFGRTDLDDEGLRRFKLGWGATEERLDYLRLGRRLSSRNFRGQNHSIANAFFRRMPLSLNKLAGAIIYPHID
jgi:CelD/BcsL family acetyltransferase involved in cellulose biosynthesis